MRKSTFEHPLKDILCLVLVLRHLQFKTSFASKTKTYAISVKVISDGHTKKGQRFLWDLERYSKLQIVNKLLGFA
jgi:hypothetical protein